MCAVKDGQSVVIDRESDQDKSLAPSGPRIRCPLCGWMPRNEDRWSCSCGHQWNTFDTGEPAHHAFTDRLRRSASRVRAGRRIRTGICSDH